MKSYLEQLTIQSENQKVSLRDAFNWAGLSKTTYYRQLKGTELRYETAIKIERAIDQLATLQKNKGVEQRAWQKCDACGQQTQYFVVFLYKSSLICHKCYEEDTWLAKIKQKEATTKGGF